MQTLLSKVQQKTIALIVHGGVALGTLLYTDEYDIYSRPPKWGFLHRSVNRRCGEYALDKNGDGKSKEDGNTHGWLLVFAPLLTATAPRIFTRATAALFGLFQLAQNARNHRKSLFESLIMPLVSWHPWIVAKRNYRIPTHTYGKPPQRWLNKYLGVATMFQKRDEVKNINSQLSQWMTFGILAPANTPSAIL